MGKTKVLCETGAGAHLIATAAACAKFNFPCDGYMGKDDIIKRVHNGQTCLDIAKYKNYQSLLYMNAVAN